MPHTWYFVSQEEVGMKCKFCGGDIDVPAMVPARGKFGGDIEALSCVGCAIREGIYCTKHNSPHAGFVGDDTTACLFCINEEVIENEKVAEQVYQRLKDGLDKAEWTALCGEILIANAITGGSDHSSLYRFIVTKAHRLHVPAETVVLEILEKKSVMMILPDFLFG
jgi:hypothetical protein